MVLTLCSHEIREVPNKLANYIFLPFLIKHVVVVLQNCFLILFCKHHGRILERKKKSITDFNFTAILMLILAVL